MATNETPCDEGILWRLAQNFGVAEASLRLLLSIFIGYPLALFLRDNLHGTSAVTKHLYVIVCGLCISYFNYGLDTKYLLFCCIANYTMLSFIGGTGMSVTVSFVFNMGYLFWSYFMFATDDYDMNWTSPQCILSLRMISVAYDLFDGHRPVEKLSSEQKSLCIKDPPGFVELLSYSFFFGYFLAGPQFPLRNYREFVDGKLVDNDEGKPSDTSPIAMKILSLGIIYLLIEATISPIFSENYLLTDEFAESSFMYKIFYIALFGKFTLNKYITFWLLTEGICVLSGIAYNGKDKEGKAKWDSCAGVEPYGYETSLSCRDVIRTFNISTNVWVARYIYKRMKFMNNKYISQVASLVFLSFWHGFHIGYHICFMLEFFVVMFELQVKEIFEKVPILNKLSNHPLFSLVKIILLKFFLFVSLGYPLISFTLLKFYRIHQVYKQIYYVGHIFFLLWPIFSFGVVMPWFKAQKRKTQRMSQEDKTK